MDGFHLAQTELERIGRADRKGAPDTFDADGFVALLTPPAPSGHGRSTRPSTGVTCATPSPAPSRCRPRSRLVVVEGNYLLLDEHGFGPVAGLLDESWFLAPDDGLRLARLVARHEAFGKSPEAARAWSHGPDESNARLVAATAVRADVVVRLA